MTGQAAGKPRIALLLSGLPRQWRACLPTQMALLQDFPFDVFFHFWDTVDEREKNDIVSLLKPRAYAFEPPRDFSEADNDPALHRDHINIPSRMLSQYYSWREVSKLAEPFKADYDLGVRSRADLHFVYSLNEAFASLKPNDILMPWWDKGIALSDLFAVGGIEPILYYHRLYDRVREYAPGREFNPELLLTAHFEARSDFHIYTYEGQKYFFIRRPHMETYTVEQAMMEDPGRNKWLDPEVVEAHENFFRAQKGQQGTDFVKGFRNTQLKTMSEEVRKKKAERKHS